MGSLDAVLDGHLAEWLNIGFRWLHVVAGAAWIGTSFYFNFLNNALRPPAAGGDDGVSGELWAVHGGGFFHIEKLAAAPARLPVQLHWFKWEAYFTWISGLSLLFVVYYLGSSGVLVDPEVADLPRWLVAAIGLASLAAGWVVYDALCKSPLIERPLAFSAMSWVLTAAAAFGFTQVMSGRAAYVHVGALLGTLMTANVFAVIIPSQREMVAAAEQGRQPGGALGKQAERRSLHNNYMTLPVLFIMVSNHFPSTFGDAANWAILAGVVLAGAGIRHWFNLRGQGRRNVYLLPAAAVVLLGLAFVTAPRSDRGLPELPGDLTVSGREAFAIVQARCTPCHSASPSQPGFLEPPKGVAFDSLEEVRARAADIERMAIDTRTMPLGNLTGMTDEERARLARWLAAGSP